MSKYAFAAAAALSALIASSAAMATEARTDQFTVSVTVTAGCKVNATGNVFFGGEAKTGGVGTGVGNGVLGTGLTGATVDKDIKVTCTRGTGYGLTLSSGNTANPFKMAGTSGNTDKIPYSVAFTSSTAADQATVGGTFPTSGTSLLGATNSFLGNGDEQTVSVTLTIGRLATLPKVDTYSDVVTVGVNF